MVASYPGSPYPFTLKTDLVDKVLADHVNALQYEVAALESTVGLNPHISTAPNPASVFNALVTTFDSVGARLANIEIGVVGDSHSQYVRNSGGAVVSTTTNSVIPLTVVAKSGQTTDILRVTGPAGSPVYMNVDQNGVLYNNTQAIPLGRVASAKITINSSTSTGEQYGTGLQCSWTVVSGRKYKYTVQMVLGDAGSGGGGVQLRLREGSIGGSIQGFANLSGANIEPVAIGTHVFYSWYLDSLSPGAHSIAPTIQPFSGNIGWIAGPANPGFAYVEDIGT